MAIRLLKNGNCFIPAEFRDGKLQYELNGKTQSIEIPSLSKYVFERQFCTFSSNNIMAYLTNDTHSLILRYDGTGCLYVHDGKRLQGSFAYDKVSFDVQESFDGGTIVNLDDKYILEVYKLGSDDYLAYGPSGISVRFSSEYNKQYIDLAKQYGLRVIIQEYNGKLYICNNDLDRVFAINGEYMVYKGLLNLGGVTFNA